MVYKCSLGLGLGSRTRKLMVRIRKDMVRVRKDWRLTICKILFKFIAACPKLTTSTLFYSATED